MEIIPNNALLEAAIHRTFSGALTQLGCSMAPRTVFLDQIQPHLRARALPFTDSVQNRLRLWKSLDHARIIATEVLDDDHLGFLVRGCVTGTYVDLRLAYHADQWFVLGIVALHRRPLADRLFMRPAGLVTLAIGSAFVGGLCAAFVHATGTTSGLATAQSWARDNGYVLVKQSDVNQSLAVATADASTPSTEGAGKSTGATQTEQGQSKGADGTQSPADTKAGGTGSGTVSRTGSSDAGSTVTFTLQMGMVPDDLSRYLYQQGMISSAADFDQQLSQANVDRTLRPGTYTFTKGMTTSQLLQALQNGPTS